LGKRLAVVDESGLVLPRELHQCVTHKRDTLGEVLGIKGLALQHLAGRNLDPSQRRLAVEPGAFIELTAGKNQPLGECIRIVWK
jgi:hypothetical protein